VLLKGTSLLPNAYFILLYDNGTFRASWVPILGQEHGKVVSQKVETVLTAISLVATREVDYRGCFRGQHFAAQTFLKKPDS